MASKPSGIAPEALKKEKAEKLSEEIDYIRFRESFRGIERGTVIAGKRVIWGFPHIKRIFTLENGIRKNMKGETLHAEEKIDGFNIRIAYIGGKIYAFSRGGFLDSFVTEKARETPGFERFFRDNPEYVICAEMIGNTPYTRPVKDFDVKIFIFDIDEGDGEYLPCAERYNLIKKYGLNGVPVLGKFRASEYKKLHDLIAALNKGKREGMVLKSADRETVVKYVTPFADIDDISNASATFFDMPIGFYYQRVLRSAFFIREQGLDREEYAKRLGKAFYEGLEQAIRKAYEGRDIAEEFEIRIGNPGIWNDIRKHMSRDVKIEEIERRKEGEKTRIRFRKIYKRTSKTLISYAAGKGITD